MSYRLDGIKRVVIFTSFLCFVGVFYLSFLLNRNFASWNKCFDVTTAVMQDICTVALAEMSKSYLYLSGSVDPLGILYIGLLSIAASLFFGLSLLSVFEICKLVMRGFGRSE